MRRAVGSVVRRSAQIAQSFRDRCIDLWRRARQEHSTPPEVGWSVAIGVFCGCTPFIGLHMWMALGITTLLRLNRLWSFVGSRISSSVVFSLLAFAEIEVAHRLRCHTWVPLAPSTVLSQARPLLTDWLVGSLMMGTLLGALLGLSAYRLARRWSINPQTPDESLPRTSESPQRAPRVPIA